MDGLAQHELYESLGGMDIMGLRRLVYQDLGVASSVSLISSIHSNGSLALTITPEQRSIFFTVLFFSATSSIYVVVRLNSDDRIG